MTFWMGGGVGPLYLCDDHAKAFNPKGAELIAGNKNRVA